MIERQDDIDLAQDESRDFTIGKMDDTDTIDHDADAGGLESLCHSSRRRQRLLLALVVASGGAAIWALKYYGGDVSEARGDSVVEQLIDHFLDDVSSDEQAEQVDGYSDRNLEVLQQSYSRHQVPGSELRSNPFLVMDRFQVDSSNGSGLDSLEHRRDRRLLELEEYVFDLDISSTMTGSSPMASISGQVVQVGEYLDGTPEGMDILLKSVARGSVTLEASDRNMDLSATWNRTVGN